ncbi:hypothetical protein ACFQS1_17330 [Paractinoplanes rhizophilus]|uniref:Uncharacterized protein n=1 Tax=Paractinoplanes rhizophilus TaxID=1416877 RepID=A0ABW2HRF4_9ACTN
MTDDDRSRPGDPVPGPAVAGPGLLLSESLAAAAAYRGLPGPLGKDFVL